MLHKLLRSARTQFNRPIQVIWERPRRLRVYCMGRRMPSWEVFDRQDKAYRDGVLPPGVKARGTVEQASRWAWERYPGLEGGIIGMNTFGTPASLKEPQRKFAFEPNLVVAAAKQRV